MPALDFAPKPANSVGYRIFNRLLGGPTELIRSWTQVAACDENDGVRHTPHAILTKDPVHI